MPDPAAVISGVEIRIEKHGDFACAGETTIFTKRRLQTPSELRSLNSFMATKKWPRNGAVRLGMAIRHVHSKDLRVDQQEWVYDLTDEGAFPLLELNEVLQDLQYDRFVPFEWGRNWHPQIADAEIAVPHFARWFRKNYA